MTKGTVCDKHVIIENLRKETRQAFRVGVERNRNICLALSQVAFILFVGNDIQSHKKKGLSGKEKKKNCKSRGN